jgi:hypothetical protein
MFAGRAATPAEIDELAVALREKVGEVAIISEERHQFDEHSKAKVHQVRIELPREQLPSREDEVYELQGRLIEAAEHWARGCIDERHVDVGDT